jgi:hypothetical protein
MTKKPLILGAALVVVTLALFAAVWRLCAPYRVFDLSTKEGWRISITARPHFMDEPSLHFEATRNGVIRLPEHSFYTPHKTSGRLDYRALSLNDGSLIAVYEASTPHCLDVIIDTVSGDHYPCTATCVQRPANAPSDHLDVLRNKLVSRIRMLTSDNRYKAADQYILGIDD